MKIIAILYPAHYEQSNGGAELQIKYFARAAVNAGHEVHYIYEDKKKPIKNDLGLILHPLTRINDLMFCGKGWFRYRVSINKQLDSISPNIIYTRLGSSWIDVAARYAKRHNIKHIHALASDVDVRRRVFSTVYPFFAPIENYLINRGLHSVSVAIAQNQYQEDTFTVRFKRPCIQVAQMTPFLDERLIRKDNGLIRILWIGNFKQIKRPEIFVELANQLNKYSDSIIMEMYGRLSSKYNKLMDIIQTIPWLEYKGEVSTSEMLSIMQCSHLLVNTSEYEGFSNTFVQAWMRKMPVISMGSNPNNVFDYYNIGVFVPHAEELASVISNLIENNEALRDMAEASYKYAVQYHSLEHNMNKVLSLL